MQPLTPDQIKTYSNLLASRFVAQTRVKAKQFGPSARFSDGGYAPVHDGTYENPGEYIPWKRADFAAHVTGEKSFGHYLINDNDQCKLFAFDIDLAKTGFIPAAWDEELWQDGALLVTEYTACDDLRAAWANKKKSNAPIIYFLKKSLAWGAETLTHAIREVLDIDVACAYSGNKGVHVYGLTGLIQADQAREAGLLIMETLNYKATKGEIMFASPNEDPDYGQQNLTVELFPKQGSLEGKELGNLMRLPLGRNLKSPDPAFFFGFQGGRDLRPADPERALAPSANPYSLYDI